MKQTARFGFTSIKSSQAYDTHRRQMTPSPLPLNEIALQGCTPPFNSQWQTTFRPTQTLDYNGPPNLLLYRCLLFLIVLPPLFCIPSPSLFQHLCWVHARASDKALCVPSLGNLPRFSSWLPAPPSWKPHNCLPFSCTPQSLSNPGRFPP